MPLSSNQKRYLRGIAHLLDPVIMVGQKGVTPALLKEFDGALAHHELVKVKLADADREDRAETIDALREASQVRAGADDRTRRVRFIGAIRDSRKSSCRGSS